jgi:hypothetical protein
MNQGDTYGSWSRLNADTCTYRVNLAQSVGPGNYATAAYAKPNCGTCFSSDPWRQGGAGGSRCADRSLVDVDSELIGITRPATNCPTGLFQGFGQPFCGGLRAFPDCREAIGTEDCRLSDPPCNIRETTVNRWEWLCQDPQERVEVPFDFMINSQLVAKDNHRPCIPTPLDQGLALPKPKSDAPVQYQPPACMRAGGGGQPTLTAQPPPTITWRSC